MSPATLSRLSGGALIVGGLLFSLGNLMHPLDHSLASQAQPTWIAAHVTFLFGGMVMVLGLPMVYARQAARTGWFGLVSFVLLTFGLIGLAPSGYYEAFVAPAVGEAGMHAIESGPGAAFNGIMGLVYLGGALLFAIATFWARVYPRPAAALIALTTLVLVAVSPFTSQLAGIVIIASTAIWGAAFAWIGAAHLAALRSASTPVATAALSQVAPSRQSA